MSLQNDYTKSYPLDVRLLNQDHESVLYISNDPQNVSITITNVSDEAIQFNSPESGTSADDFHQILVTFKPDIIDPTNEIAVSSEHSWAMGKAKIANNGSIMVAFQLSDELILQPAEQTTIALANLKANASSGARVTQVQVNVDEISFTSDTNKLIPYTLTTQLSIINQRGKKNIPLHFGFAGSNTVLNDGASESDLTLQITNISTVNLLNPDLSEISFNCDSEANNQTYFTISFITSDDEILENAIGTTNDLTGLSITDADKNWGVETKDEGINTDWVVTPKKELPPMKSGEQIDLHIKKIVSSAPTGLTYMKLSYFNIPGYWDGDVMVPIMKQPLVMRSFTDKNDKVTGSIVGIGTMPEEASLTIDHNHRDDGNLIVDGNLQVNGRIADKSGVTVPVNGIIMWNGSEDNIPDGWALCDGKNGTPNLLSRFVMAAGGPIEPHRYGGNHKIKLETNQLPNHDHNVRLGEGTKEESDEPADGKHTHRLYVDCGDGGDHGVQDYKIVKVSGYSEYNANHRAEVANDESEHTHKVYQDNSFDNESIDIMPKFYTLCFIMKLEEPLTPSAPEETPSTKS